MSPQAGLWRPVWGWSNSGAERYWQDARATFSTGRYSFVVTATGAAVFRSVLSRANA